MLRKGAGMQYEETIQFRHVHATDAVHRTGLATHTGACVLQILLVLERPNNRQCTDVQMEAVCRGTMTARCWTSSRAKTVRAPAQTVFATVCREED
jgi:hypothetical protein